MITIKRHDNHYEVSAWTRPPLVYLDHWALRHFSSEPAHRERFLSVITIKGTLLFSLANVLEISKNSGRSAEDIRSFLSDVGKQWFPLEINPIKVIEEERRQVSGKNSPCFAAQFLEAYAPRLPDGSPSLSATVDLIQDKEVRDTIHENVLKLTTRMGEYFQSARQQWRLGQKDKNVFTDSVFDPHRPTDFVYHGFVRLLLEEDFKD